MSEADVGMAVFRNQFGVLMHVARAQLEALVGRDL